MHQVDCFGFLIFQGLGKDSSYPGRKHDYGSQYGHAKHGTTEYSSQRGRADGSGKVNAERNSVYQNESTEPCYFSSSIYYGGQEVYSPAGQTTNPPPNFKKDGGDDDPNGNNSSSASRGNWWQGSLYY
ncbi:OLC1v1026654C3 [Oldenlandia corymbosa var. corymbosa]|uniref:OLC1v1026654C3 n=1 Tax=Oldenlandia corymbosa var. corymbosa TaxID=529605 RepID=A0AAV1C7K3_OLDCO|nr:OLC1v1026654C3 [Oldenlandia corymbosa var. corymbosa]